MTKVYLLEDYEEGGVEVYGNLARALESFNVLGQDYKRDYNSGLPISFPLVTLKQAKAQFKEANDAPQSECRRPFIGGAECKYGLVEQELL